MGLPRRRGQQGRRRPGAARFRRGARPVRGGGKRPPPRRRAQSREGPADWARVRIVDLEARYGAGYRDEQGNRYRAVLAFDTGLIAEAEGRAYLAPSPKDVTSGALFALAPQQRANHWLLRQGWLSQWLGEVFRELFPRGTLEG